MIVYKDTNPKFGPEVSACRIRKLKRFKIVFIQLQVLRENESSAHAHSQIL